MPVSEMITILGSAVASLVGVVLVLPKMLNAFKNDNLNSDVLTRLAAMEKHAAMQDRRAIAQDVKIHQYAVKVTRLMVVVIRLESLLMERRGDIPKDVVDEIADLKKQSTPESGLDKL